MASYMTKCFVDETDSFTNVTVYRNLSVPLKIKKQLELSIKKLYFMRKLHKVLMGPLKNTHFRPCNFVHTVKIKYAKETCIFARGVNIHLNCTV